VILGLTAIIGPVYAALNATQRNALIVSVASRLGIFFFFSDSCFQSLGLCSASSNFTCTSSKYDSCDPGLGCTTNGDLIWFGAFSGTVPWRPRTVPTQLNLFPTLTWMYEHCMFFDLTPLCREISNRSLSGTIPNLISFPQLQSLFVKLHEITLIRSPADSNQRSQHEQSHWNCSELRHAIAHANCSLREQTERNYPQFQHASHAVFVGRFCD
jgi:hypothetical protein